MAMRNVLSRLLRIRELEEEQSRVRLEELAGARARVGLEMESAIRENGDGRAWFQQAIAGGDALGRAEGLAAMEVAGLRRAWIAPLLREAEEELERQREEFLGRSTDRLQAETLDAEARAGAELEAGRRAQQMLDDWYGRRRRKPPEGTGGSGRG